MRKIVLFAIGLLITSTALSQNKVKVYNISYIYYAMIIPDGEKFILEEYDKIKYYYLRSADTIVLIKDSIFLKLAQRWMNIDEFSKEYDFCDKQINKIRNFALSQRILFMLNDSCNKYIEPDNKEYFNFRRDLTSEIEIKENVCSDTYSSIMYKRFDSIINKVKETYEIKVQRAEWIKKNPAEIDNEYISSFLIDYGCNGPDEEVFVQILITHPAALIKEIDKHDMRNMIIWRVKLLNNIEWISKVTESLENTDLKCKTKRQILRELKKKRANTKLYPIKAA
jgi:hypothetical protein